MDEFYPIYKINSFEEGPLLKKNDIHDIIVKNIDRIDPHDKFQFDFQISSNQFLSTTLKGTLKSFYENRKTKMISLIKFDSYTPCVYFDADKNEWCRGEILKLISGNVYAVKLVDYGEIKCLNSFYLKACDKKFLKPFKQAYSASLNILSNDNELDEESTLDSIYCEFKKKYLNKKIKCKIVDCSSPVKYFLNLNIEFDENNNIMDCRDHNKISKNLVQPLKYFQKVDYLNDLDLNYVKAKSCKIFVTYVISPSKFYVQLIENYNKIKKRYFQDTCESAPILGDTRVKKACAARWCYDNQWYRAEIIECDLGRSNALVCFVDFGITQACRFWNLKELSAEFNENKCAVLVNLKNVEEKKWAESEIFDFEELARFKQIEFDGNFNVADKNIEWNAVFSDLNCIKIDGLVERCIQRKIFKPVSIPFNKKSFNKAVCIKHHLVILLLTNHSFCISKLIQENSIKMCYCENQTIFLIEF